MKINEIVACSFPECKALKVLASEGSFDIGSGEEGRWLTLVQAHGIHEANGATTFCPKHARMICEHEQWTLTRIGRLLTGLVSKERVE